MGYNTICIYPDISKSLVSRSLFNMFPYVFQHSLLLLRPEIISFSTFVPFNSKWCLMWTSGTRGAHCYSGIISMYFQKKLKTRKYVWGCVCMLYMYISLFEFILIISIQSNTIMFILGLLPFTCNIFLPKWET